MIRLLLVGYMYIRNTHNQGMTVQGVGDIWIKMQLCR